MRLLGLLFILCMCVSAFSQQTKTDSLLKVLSKSKEDTFKVKTLHNLFFEVEYVNQDKAKEYLTDALTLSKKLNYTSGQILTYKYLGFLAEDRADYKEALINYNASLKLCKQNGDKTGECAAYNNMGIVYGNQGDYTEALKYYFLSMNLSKKLGNKKTLYSACNNIGNIYKYQGNYPEAIKYFLLSLKLSEELGNQQAVLTCYNNIGTVNVAQEKHDEALKNYTKALSISKAIDYKKGIENSYNNIANIYSTKKDYQKALAYFDSCLKICIEIGDKYNEANAYGNRGNVYYLKNEIGKAIENHLRAIELNKEIGNKAAIANVYSNLGDDYAKQKNFVLAKQYLLLSQVVSKEVGNRDVLRNTYRSLAVLNADQQNYKDAYENFGNYILYRDSLVNEEADKKIIQSQMNFEFDKKEAIAKAEHKKELQNQQALAEEKSRKQKIVISLVIAALILAGIFTVFILRSLRITRKQKRLIELQKALVEKQKLEVEQQKHLVEEHQKEIIDSITYAKRIQRAIIPSAEDIEKNLPNSFVLYKPKDIVAGDFYWMHHAINEDLILIAAADSTGHGVPGAMVSVVCSNALNRAVDEFGLSEPGKILDKTRDLVLETFAKSGEEIKDGMDISMLSLNKKTKEIKWSGANNQLCYASGASAYKSLDGEMAKKESMSPEVIEGLGVALFEVKADKQPIGKTENPKPFTTHTFEMKEGDIFYLITDGYADQFGGPKGKKFKFKQLEELLISSSSLSPKEQLNALNKAFDNWAGSLEQVDDVTIIGVRV